MAHNRKLSPVDFEQSAGRPRPVPRQPFICTTDASIAATCGACILKDAGCYPKTGLTKFAALRLDKAARGMTPEEVIAAEVALIDRAFPRGVPQDGARGGRDLRLHVSGDAGSSQGARQLAGAAERWCARGGGVVFGYTRLWRAILRSDFGPINILASVDRPEDIVVARRHGYAAAIVVAEFPEDGRAFTFPGVTERIVPCPAQTRGKTCAECRLCIDVDLLGLNLAIALKVHGAGAKAALSALALANEGRLPAFIDGAGRRHLPVVR